LILPASGRFVAILCHQIDDPAAILLMLIGKYPVTDYPAMEILPDPISIVFSMLLQLLV